jgi:predicted dinucleotide-binding enzyme
MFMAGSDDAAKNAAAQLYTDLGFDPMDASDITKSRLLEQFGMGWINQALFRAKGSMAVKVGFEPTVRFPVHTLSKRAP